MHLGSELIKIELYDQFMVKKSGQYCGCIDFIVFVYFRL